MRTYTQGTLEIIESDDGRARFTLLTLPSGGIDPKITAGHDKRRAELAAAIDRRDRTAPKWRRLKTSPPRPRLPKSPDAELPAREPYAIGDWVEWTDSGTRIVGQIWSQAAGAGAYWVTTDRSGETGRVHLMERRKVRGAGKDALYAYSIGGASVHSIGEAGADVDMTHLPDSLGYLPETPTSYADYVPAAGMQPYAPVPVHVGPVEVRGDRVWFPMVIDGIRMDADARGNGEWLVSVPSTGREPLVAASMPVAKGLVTQRAIGMLRELKDCARGVRYGAGRKYEIKEAPAFGGECHECRDGREATGNTRLFRFDQREVLKCATHLARALSYRTHGGGYHEVTTAAVEAIGDAQRVMGMRDSLAARAMIAIITGEVDAPEVAQAKAAEAQAEESADASATEAEAHADRAEQLAEAADARGPKDADAAGSDAEAASRVASAAQRCAERIPAERDTHAARARFAVSRAKDAAERALEAANDRQAAADDERCGLAAADQAEKYASEAREAAEATERWAEGCPQIGDYPATLAGWVEEAREAAREAKDAAARARHAVTTRAPFVRRGTTHYDEWYTVAGASADEAHQAASLAQRAARCAAKNRGQADKAAAQELEHGERVIYDGPSKIPARGAFDRYDNHGRAYVLLDGSYSPVLVEAAELTRDPQPPTHTVRVVINSSGGRPRAGYDPRLEDTATALCSCGWSSPAAKGGNWAAAQSSGRGHVEEATAAEAAEQGAQRADVAEAMQPPSTDEGSTGPSLETSAPNSGADTAAPVEAAAAVEVMPVDQAKPAGRGECAAANTCGGFGVLLWDVPGRAPRCAECAATIMGRSPAELRALTLPGDVADAEEKAQAADIVILHTHEDGTTVEGSSKGDGVWEALRPLGWTYRRTPGIFIRGSRYKGADRWKINRAADAVRTLDLSCAVVIEETMSFAEREAARVDVAEERTERYGERAGRAAARSEGAWQASHGIADHMTGEPIKIGHHSERRHRRDIERMDNHMRRAITEDKKAGYWASRAQAAEAYERYRKNPGRTLRRIEKLEAERRSILRERDGVDDKGRKADVWRREPSEARRGELTRRLAEKDEELTYWAETIKEAERHGFKIWGRADFVKGDYVRYRGTWYEVTRVNAKSVTIPHIHAAFDGGAVGAIDGCRVVTRAAAQAAGRMGVHTYTAAYNDGIDGRMSAEQMRAALAGEAIPAEAIDSPAEAPATDDAAEVETPTSPQSSASGTGTDECPSSTPPAPAGTPTAAPDAAEESLTADTGPADPVEPAPTLDTEAWSPAPDGERWDFAAVRHALARAGLPAGDFGETDGWLIGPDMWNVMINRVQGANITRPRGRAREAWEVALAEYAAAVEGAGMTLVRRNAHCLVVSVPVPAELRFTARAESVGPLDSFTTAVAFDGFAGIGGTVELLPTLGSATYVVRDHTGRVLHTDVGQRDRHAATASLAHWYGLPTPSAYVETGRRPAPAPSTDPVSRTSAETGGVRLEPASSAPGYALDSPPQERSSPRAPGYLSWGGGCMVWRFRCPPVPLLRPHPNRHPCTALVRGETKEPPLTPSDGYITGSPRNRQTMHPPPQLQ